ncbi:MAG: alpha/beta fold hydrolase [Candidatus Dormibacter sp.]|uniref:alpha/beta fold hydrolase n=1 Tax=Candidatus Dormibacter sp. TaxID=2973982 RepID=UPI000DB185A5|nr:MAG: aminopeptidase [Candidatus Dormibacteraeota bacterium]
MAEVREQHEAVELRVPGLVLTEHEFSVPLDHARPDADHISVFAREVADPGGLERPYLVFFQGGPGTEAPRPTRFPSSPGWLDRALQEYRVLMLDQRGTGRSSPIGSLPGLSAERQADHLARFRADSIVLDAELIRHRLGVDRWSVLGQSFGGFCVTSYLSLAPDGLREAFITGGLPPLARPVDDVYSATYRRVLERNRRYHERYPQDRERLRRLRQRLEETEVRLPGGDRLTWRRFRQLGSALGMSDGAAKLHHLLELPADSPAFLHDVETGAPFARNPLYAILHEASYADGCVTGWSAERLLPPEFNSSELLTGEHVYHWMFEDYSALRPLAAAAELLAQRKWPRLYDEVALSRCAVPAAAAIYSDDMYVERGFSEETARAICGLRVWLTSEYDHNGLRADGGRILDRLIHLAHNPA